MAIQVNYKSKITDSITGELINEFTLVDCYICIQKREERIKIVTNDNEGEDDLEAKKFISYKFCVHKSKRHRDNGTGMINRISFDVPADSEDPDTEAYGKLKKCFPEHENIFEDDQNIEG